MMVRYSGPESARCCKARCPSDKMAYHKEGTDEMGAGMIHEYSSLPIRCSEYCLKELRHALVHCS